MIDLNIIFVLLIICRFPDEMSTWEEGQVVQESQAREVCTLPDERWTDIEVVNLRKQGV